MRHGFLRSLSALLSGTAFAVTVAGPVQFDPCPEHGVGAVSASVAAAMDMPAGEEMAVVHAPADGAHGHHAAGHVCTCPGGCCSSSPLSLHVGNPASLAALVLLDGGASALPAAALTPSQSPQLRLALANAPPAARASSQGAAHHST
jgi:hypothetical protein